MSAFEKELPFKNASAASLIITTVFQLQCSEETGFHVSCIPGSFLCASLFSVSITWNSRTELEVRITVIIVQCGLLLRFISAVCLIFTVSLWHVYISLLETAFCSLLCLRNGDFRLRSLLGDGVMFCLRCDR